MSRLDRRQLIQSLSAAPLLGGARRDVIGDENKRPGTTDWQLTYTKVDPATRYRSPLIEGYASRASLRPGEKIDICVSTNPASRFVIDLYRLGYYQGKGGRHVLRLGPFAGKTQPTPPVGKARLRKCTWSKAVSLEVPKDWVSGVYLGKLSALDHRYQSYVVFIVRDDRPADFLFQCSDNTWQAYNAWPDNYSLYHNDRPDKKPLVSGVQVSYDRPYGKYMQIVCVHGIAGMRDGRADPFLSARTHSVKNFSTPRPCCRQLPTTVSIRSTNRLPPALSVPWLVFRQQTA